MDKKGFVSSYMGMSITFLMLILLIVNLIPIQEGVMTEEEVINNLDWYDSDASKSLMTSDNKSVIVNVVFKLVDAIGYSSFEVSKVAVRWGNDNLRIKATTLALLLLLALISPILLNLIKLSLVLFVFLRDWKQSKDEKTKLNILKITRNKSKSNIKQ